MAHLWRAILAAAALGMGGCLGYDIPDAPEQVSLHDQHAFVADHGPVSAIKSSDGALEFRRIATLYTPEREVSYYGFAGGPAVAGGNSDVPRLDLIQVRDRGERSGIIVQLGQASFSFTSTYGYGVQRFPGYVSAVKSSTGAVGFDWSAWAAEKKVLLSLHDRSGQLVGQSVAALGSDGEFTYTPKALQGASGTGTRSLDTDLNLLGGGAVAACGMGPGIHLACGSSGGGGDGTSSHGGISVNIFVYSVLMGIQHHVDSVALFDYYQRMLLKDGWATMASLKRAFGTTVITNWDDAQTAIQACRVLTDLKKAEMQPSAAPVRYYRSSFGLQPVK